MTTAFLAIFIILDFVLLAIMYFLHNNWKVHDNLLLDITEERRLIKSIQDDVQNRVDGANKDIHATLAKVTHIGAQIEQEVGNASNTISKNIDEIVLELSNHFEKPLSELIKRQKSIEAMEKRLSHKHEQLTSATKRAEQLTQFFSKKIPYEDIKKNLEKRKYEDARKMISQGYSNHEICKELGISSKEVELMIGLV